MFWSGAPAKCCVCVWVLFAWLHMLSYYTTLYRGEFSSLPSLPQKESSHHQDWWFLSKAQSRILNAPLLGYLAACAFPLLL